MRGGHHEAREEAAVLLAALLAPADHVQAVLLLVRPVRQQLREVEAVRLGVGLLERRGQPPDLGGRRAQLIEQPLAHEVLARLALAADHHHHAGRGGGRRRAGLREGRRQHGQHAAPPPGHICAGRRSAGWSGLGLGAPCPAACPPHLPAECHASTGTQAAPTTAPHARTRVAHEEIHSREIGFCKECFERVR